MTLFDAYVMVDWSAAAVPTTGRDSIWIAIAAGRNERAENPPTRAAAMASLRAALLRLRGAGKRVLVGFDFPFGYPSGFATALGLPRDDWRSLWRFFSDSFADAPDNANDRFRVAGRINRDRFGGLFPFWGHPPGRRVTGLSKGKRHDFARRAFAERRLCELRPGARSAKTVWQLAYSGSVGSQVLLGVPRVLALREDPALRDQTRIWPFETRCRGDDRPPVVIAEIWPSLWPEAWRDLEARAQCKDEAQVRGLARHLARLDRAGMLASMLDPPLPADTAERVTREEAWILGRRMIDYLRDPQAIYRRSFSTIRAEAPLDRLPADIAPLALRIVHACGMPDIVADLAFSPEAGAIGRAALARGATILCDARMVADGIIATRLPPATRIVCTLDAPETAARAKRESTTRSAAAIAAWRPLLDGAIVAIGNAPTALFRLLEELDAGASRPALILGFPVGFVGAAESKAELARDPRGCAFVTVHGRRGGSAIAAAAVNALAGNVEEAP